MADLIRYPRWPGDRPDDRHLAPIDDDFWQRFSLYRAEVLAQTGRAITVVSGYRFYDEQVRLYNAYLAGTGNLAAKPGTSNHERGLAIDQEPNYDAVSIAIAAKYGQDFPIASEHWHIEPVSTRGRPLPPLPGGAQPPAKGKKRMSVIVNGEDGGVYLWDRDGGQAKHLRTQEEVDAMAFLGYQRIEGSLTNVALAVLTAGGGRPSPAGY